MVAGFRLRAVTNALALRFTRVYLGQSVRTVACDVSTTLVSSASPLPRRIEIHQIPLGKLRNLARFPLRQ